MQKQLSREWKSRVRFGLSRATLVLAIFVACSLIGESVHAQADSLTSDSADTQARADVSPGSPQAAVENFLSLARAGKYADAADYLDLADSARASGSILARRLKAILDRHL